MPLHLLARTCSLKTPDAASTMNCKGNLPLHELMINPEIVFEKGDTVVQAIMAAYPAAVSTANAEGNLPLHVLVNSSPSIRFAHQVNIVEILLRASPGAASVANSAGLLPSHIAIRNKLPWMTGLKAILEAAPDSILRRDPETGLYPFQLAGMVGGRGATEKVFLLLSAGPELVRTLSNT